MIEMLQYEFMRNALIAAVLVNVACGIVGTYVVTKRMVFISGGISHATFGGIGLGYLFGVNPILAAIPFSLLSALAIGTISKREYVSEDTSIGILWAVGMALGIIFIGLSPAYAPDLFSYLFGSILTVPSFDLIMMVILDVIIVLIVLLFYKEFLAISFDEEFSEVIGVPTKSLYLLLLCLVALSVVVLIRVVGIILVIALLTIPAAISRQFTYNIKKLMLLSIFIGIILTTVGLMLSYVFDLASGATIVLVLGGAFLLCLFLKHFLSVFRHYVSLHFETTRAQADKIRPILGKLFRFFGWWFAFSGLYAMSARCPFCGQVGCPVGASSVGLVGGFFALCTQNWKAFVTFIVRLFRRS